MEPINWHSFFFLLFALISCGSAIAVVISGNIVRMAVYLVLSLAAVAGLFFLAGADFLGAMQLMVYVGGTMVLLVFGVMLTAKGPFVSMQTGGGQWVMAAIAGGSLAIILLQTAVSVENWSVGSSEPAMQNTATDLGMGLVGVRVDQIDETNETIRGGMSGYLLPFEIVSVHLLVVLVGAAYLARAKRRVRRKTETTETK